MKSKLTGTLLIALFIQLNIATARIVPPTAIKASAKAKLAVEALTKNLEFKFCKAAILENDQTQLRELAEFLAANKYAISLRGHADAIGTYVGNWKMSEARAAAVKEFLIKKGVSEDRIVTTAFGSTIPIANNKTSKGRQKNRRVEIRLKEIGS